ncbi:MAG TPA: hypothetical protein VJY62_09830, partial [Bacteroidia bacterium]|nr:hypothetical protein [Bacteroidia bacterium]
CEFNNELLDWFDGGSFEISSSNLKAPFIFYGNKIRCNFNLTNDTMNAVVMFANVNNTGSSVVPGNSYVLSEENNDFQFKVSIINCHFEKQLNFAGNTFNYDFQFKNSTCNDSVRFSSTSFNNNATFNYIKCRKYLTFNKSRMSKYVELLNLRGSGFMDFSGINFSKNYLPEKDIEEILDEFQLPEYVIGNTCFYIPDPDSVYLAKRIDSTLTKYPGLCYKSNFDENTTIALDENFIARQEIPIENIEKINFDFTNTSPDAPLGEQVHAMRELKRKILSQSDVLEEVRKGAAGKIDFIMAEYDRKNAKHWYDSAFLGFLFYTVNHGYKGGSQFFKLIFIVLFLFSLVYYLGFRKEVIGYIDEKTKKEGAMSDINDIHKKAKPTREFLLFFQSLWLSTVIFVNPRYPTDYFRFNDRMQVFIILEWIIGISMLAVYVIYIASNYGFIKSLVGI